jgi:hypothetical protein
MITAEKSRDARPQSNSYNSFRRLGSDVPRTASARDSLVARVRARIADLFRG